MKKGISPSNASSQEHKHDDPISHVHSDLVPLGILHGNWLDYRFLPNQQGFSLEDVMAFNAAEPKQVRAAAKIAKIEERQRLAEIRQQMSTIAGRQYMLEKLERAHIFASSFNTNALTMAFAEGERNLGLMLLNDIMITCPDQYVKMMQERNERDHAREQLSESSDRPEAADGPEPAEPGPEAA